jgi:hypothetical protein
VIEITRFRPAPGVDEAALVAAKRRLREEFDEHTPGLLGRTVARGEDGSWIMINLWRASADADAADARWERHELRRPTLALLDSSSVSVERYQEVD